MVNNAYQAFNWIIDFRELNKELIILTINSMNKFGVSTGSSNN